MDTHTIYIVKKKGAGQQRHNTTTVSICALHATVVITDNPAMHQTCLAVSTGMANDTPSAAMAFIFAMPTTSPLRFTNGPPLLPCGRCLSNPALDTTTQAHIQAVQVLSSMHTSSNVHLLIKFQHQACLPHHSAFFFQGRH